MHATLEPQRWPLVALLAVFVLALMAALAPGVSEFDLSGISGHTSEPAASPTATRGTDAVPVWLRDPLEPPLVGMERALGAR